MKFKKVTTILIAGFAISQLSQAMINLTVTEVTPGNVEIEFEGSLSAEVLGATSFDYEQILSDPLARYGTSPSFLSVPEAGTFARYLFDSGATPGLQAGIRGIDRNSQSGNTASGSAFGFTVVNNNLTFLLPQGYVGGTILQGTLSTSIPESQFESAFTSGTLYSFVSSSGDVTPLITLSVVPEPSSYALLLGVFGLCFALTRRRVRN